MNDKKLIILNSKFAKDYHQYWGTWWAWLKIDKLVETKPNPETVYGLERIARAAKDEYARALFAAGSFEDLVHTALKDKRADVAAAVCRSEILDPLLQHIYPRGADKKLEMLAKTWTGSIRTSRGSGIGPKTIEAYWIHMSFGQNSADARVNELLRNKEYAELVQVLEFLASAAPNKNAMKGVGKGPHQLYRLVYIAVAENRSDIASAILASPHLPELVHYNHPRITLLQKVADGRKIKSDNE